MDPVLMARPRADGSRISPVPLALVLAGVALPSVSASEGEAAGPRTLAEIVRRVEPWVVAIEVERAKDLGRSRFQPRRLSREARDYFDRPDGYVTGVLVDSMGSVLTSYYNVGGELESIEVVVSGGKRYPARLVATSKIDDLALLRLDWGEEPAPFKEGWTDPPWNYDVPRAGRIVIAVGRSPDPGRLTVTHGIVSASSRNGDRSVQTDAKLNYGNVGGPLVDLDGTIVAVSGFVGHTYPQWGLNSGIGFGTTAATIREVLPRLTRGEDVVPPDPPFLGVQSDPDDLDTEGARITAVLDGTAAQAAGLRPGDVIVSLDGEPIWHFNMLRRVLFDRRVGDTVKMEIVRGGERRELELTLGRRQEGDL